MLVKHRKCSAKLSIFYENLKYLLWWRTQNSKQKAFERNSFLVYKINRTHSLNFFFWLQCFFLTKPCSRSLLKFTRISVHPPWKPLSKSNVIYCTLLYGNMTCLLELQQQFSQQRNNAFRWFISTTSATCLKYFKVIHKTNNIGIIRNT